MPRSWEDITWNDYEKRAEEIRTETLPGDEYILTCLFCVHDTGGKFRELTLACIVHNLDRAI